MEQLRQSGLQLDEVSPALAPGLEEQWGRGRETDLAIVFSLGKIADSAAAAVLLRMEKKAQDKDLRKEIRRSLFKLSQKGLAIPADRPGEKSPASLLNRSPEIEAYMHAFEGVDQRLFRRKWFGQDLNVELSPEPLNCCRAFKGVLVVVENCDLHDYRTAMPAISIR